MKRLLALERIVEKCNRPWSYKIEFNNIGFVKQNTKHVCPNDSRRIHSDSTSCESANVSSSFHDDDENVSCASAADVSDWNRDVARQNDVNQNQQAAVSNNNDNLGKNTFGTSVSSSFLRSWLFLLKWWPKIDDKKSYYILRLNQSLKTNFFQSFQLSSFKKCLKIYCPSIF